jgi:TRAP-type C4-dicarboxylate transport system permease small subunit
VLVTVVAVVARYLFNDPIFGITDISRLVMIVVVACSIAYGGRVGAHVAVDIISRSAGRKVTRWSDLLVRLLGIAVTACAAYALYRQGQCGLECGHITPNLSLSYAPYSLLLALGLGLYCLLLVWDLLHGLAHFAELDYDDG